jgi:putative ABC transport system permease protein
MVAMFARYASKFSDRAIDLNVDSSLLWVGAALAIVAAVILAFVPRLPSSRLVDRAGPFKRTVRITSSTNRRQQIFAVTQIAASFVLLVGASVLVSTLIALQRARTGLAMRSVLAVDVPAMTPGKTTQQVVDFYREAMRRIDALTGVSRSAFGNVVPWRDNGPGH